MAVNRQRIYHKRDRLKQLRAFYYAARLSSITQAAERLGLSQPAVSLHVRELEHELEAVLFDRGGPRISLTRAGETLYRLVSPLVEGVDDLLLNFAEHLQDTATGEVNIGAGHGGTAYLLPSLLREFRESYPGVRVHVKRCFVREGLRLLLADEIELLTGPQESLPKKTTGDRIRYRELFTYELVLATPLDHALAGRESVSREEAAAWPMIMPTGDTFSTQSGKSALQAFGVEFNVVIQAGGWSAIKRYVEAGLGVAIIPSVCITDKDPLSVIPLSQHFDVRSYGVYLRADKRLSPVAERFVDLMGRHYSGRHIMPESAATSGEVAARAVE